MIDPIKTPLDELREAEQGVPLETRRELLAVAQAARISYNWLCQLYKRGRRDAFETLASAMKKSLDANTLDTVITECKLALAADMPAPRPDAHLGGVE